ncbi:MAG TPA: efflux RND transporter periplasmic adaptor subunit, partial [Cellvibrionaceae bacterium]|nr:efflux RND transporter periplasmic adaptor subunit [Cellvibrionaceae bacterium]
MNNWLYGLNVIVQKITLKRLMFRGCAPLMLCALVFVNNSWASPEHNAAPANTAAQHDEHEHDEHADVVSLNQTQINTAGIELAQAQAAIVREYLPVYGTVAINAEKMQRVTARFKGVVRSLNKKVGDTVRAGEMLASIESDESLKTYTLTAALDGVVLERALNLGEQTDDKTVFVIADLSSLWVEIALFPSDLAKIHTGQQVRIINPNNAQQAVGELTYLAPQANSVNQAVSGRVVVPNTRHQWRPGQFVQAEVLLAEHPAAIAVCNEALHEHEGKQVVFVQEADGFKPRPVRIGRSDNTWTEIIAGLNTGETYASKNSFILKAELGKDGAE